MNFSERLKAVIKRSGLKREDFAKRVGKSRSQLFNYLGEAQVPAADFFQEIKREFPWVNIEWLITGVGEMQARPSGVSQRATGNGHVQVGGNVSGQVIGGWGNKVSAVQGVREGSVYVDLEDVVRILEDYVASKVIDEVLERLKSGK